MEESAVMMVGLEIERIRQGLAILVPQLRGTERGLRLVSDYDVPNVSDKVVRIILGYTDYVNRVVWKNIEPESMRLALVADTFPPLRTSGAVQLRDLSREFVRQGHSLCVLLPAPDQREPWALEEVEGAQVLRLKALEPKILGTCTAHWPSWLCPLPCCRAYAKSAG